MVNIFFSYEVDYFYFYFMIVIFKEVILICNMIYVYYLVIILFVDLIDFFC